MLDSLGSMGGVDGLFYAGIGSRETPLEIRRKMTALATQLEQLGYTLRSGGAEGADQAFADGTDVAEIWLPSKKKPAVINSKHKYITIDKDDAEAFRSVYIHHPYYAGGHPCDQFVEKIMARNFRQVAGYKGAPDSEFLLVWTKDGGFTGGTGQAMRIASASNIPIYNLFFEDAIQKLYSALTLKHALG